MSDSIDISPNSSFPWLDRAQLWMITDFAAARGRDMRALVADGIRGGVDIVVVRMKDVVSAAADPAGIDAAEVDGGDKVMTAEALFLREARAIADVCREHSTPWVLSHNVELAGELAPDGVHLGAADPPVNEVRRIVGNRTTIGYSAHTLDELAFNAGLGADYCFYSPICPTRKGDMMLDGLGLDAVTDAVVTAAAIGRAGRSYPVVFLGGITLENAPTLIARGARRIAAIGALIGADDVAEAARNFKRLLTQGAG